jgi:hypothetical protein
MKLAPTSKVSIFTSDDAQSTGIVAETREGKVGFALKNKNLSAFISMLLEQSQKVAAAKIATTTPQPSQRRTMTVRPVLSSGVGISKGRTESERILLVELGNMTLAFWIDEATLRGAYNDLGRASKLDDPQRPH